MHPSAALSAELPTHRQVYQGFTAVETAGAHPRVERQLTREQIHATWTDRIDDKKHQSQHSLENGDVLLELTIKDQRPPHNTILSLDIHYRG